MSPICGLRAGTGRRAAGVHDEVGLRCPHTVFDGVG